MHESRMNRCGRPFSRSGPAGLRRAMLVVVAGLLLIPPASGLTTSAMAAMTVAPAEPALQDAVTRRTPIVTTDMLRMRSVTSIDVSNDGRLAVFAVRSIDTIEPRRDPDHPQREQGDHAAADQRDIAGGERVAARSDDAAKSSPAQVRYAYRSHLFLVDLIDNRPPLQLTFGARNDHSPRLSPNGRWIAFVRSGEQPRLDSSDEGEARSQIWLMPTDGGEARQVTDLKHGATRPIWSDDGRTILVNTSVPMTELPGTPPWSLERPQRTWNDAGHTHTTGTGAGTGDDEVHREQDNEPHPAGTRAQIRAWLAQNAAKRDPSVITRLDFQGEHSLHGVQRVTQLALVEVREVGEPRTRIITASFHDHHNAAFLGSAAIVYNRLKPTGEHPDRVRQHEIWRMNVDGRDDRVLVSLEGWSLMNPRPTRDATALAFTGQQLDHPSDRQRHLGVATLDRPDRAEIAWLTDDARLSGSVSSFVWHPTQTSILFTSPQRGGEPLMTASPALPEPVAIVQEARGLPIGVQQFDAGGPSIVYSQVSVHNPNELRVRDSRGDRLVMDLNEWVHTRELSIPSGGELQRPDGTHVQYWLMPPTRRLEGQTYPLVLQIHGGPSAMWGPGEASMWHEFQLLCSWGYGVVYSNPRGSGGYGYEFQRANLQDWADGPAGDVLAAVDRAQLEEWVDRERLFITGGSYAGYLVAYIVSQDHRFQAAVAQRGVYELATFFGEGNAWRLIPWEMGGWPWDPNVRQVLRAQSPFTWVNRIRTPLLIMHASNDLRTGVSQSEMLYRGLKVLNREVEYIRYPNAGHDLSRTGEPRQRLDRLNRIIEFFERYSENLRPAPVQR